MFKEMIEEGVAQKDEHGIMIIEEILFTAEMTIRKKKKIFIEEELVKEIKDFIKFAKENGFKSRTEENEDVIVSDGIFIDWMYLFKEMVFIFIKIFNYHINFYCLLGC